MNQPTRRPTVRAAAVASVLVLVGLTSACDPSDDAVDARPGCADTVREASQAREVDEQVGLLDDALRACRTLASFRSEIERYPSIIGYDPDTFVFVRCSRTDDDAVSRSPVCRAVVAPGTTVPPTTVVSLVFVGDTLDGRTIEIRPSSRTEFVGDVPAVVQQTVDIAVESGCDGVIAQRDLWAGRVDDPVIGDEASVYAQHAQNVADYIQCNAPPISPGAPATTTATDA